MNFKEATDCLFDRVSHEQLAEALGVSIASIRQARLDPRANAFREPPKDWEVGVKALVLHRIRQLERLSKALS
jgi:hypothetical protein